ncbi:MAG TPA: DUF1990 family protein [Acidimicrobiales bacterium]|nr:DUF1990 family protein [Acidimicrobiales bacterium]
MPGPPSFGRNLATTLAWPFGVSLTSWDYMWRTTPLHRRELPGTLADDAGPALPAGVSRHELQPADAGVGPLFHRRYRVRIREAQLDAEELLARITADPNIVAPKEFARFTKVHGDEGPMRVGDEYLVRMPGPWNGPVRVVARTSTSFRLATLQGHLEAGQIELRAEDAGGGELCCAIESWACSGDRLSLLLYKNLRMAKEVQLHMWTSVLERAARLAGGRLTGGIDVETHRVDEAGGRRPLGDAGAKRMLDELHDKALNFELGDRSGFTPRTGWKVDEYCQPLPPEPPGDPLLDGSWEIARGLMRNYEFADPAIVRAVYHPDRPLEDRDMLLEARFVGLRFRFGVRVGGVRDEIRELDGRRVRVWGWNYRTLQGHLEMGQMDYEVWKWLDTGDVEFHTCRFSRRASIGNPVVRLGLWLFGRRQQVKFARHACQRMARLTEEALAMSVPLAGGAQVGHSVRSPLSRSCT